MDWKREVLSLLYDFEKVQETEHPRQLSKRLRFMVGIMLTHWPDEPEQRPDPCCSCDHWRSIVILAADILGADSYESASVEHAAKRVVKERDGLLTQVQDGVKERDVALVRIKKTEQDRDRLQAALDEQMVENGKLAKALEVM